MINLNTITLQELQELLDKKLNYTSGWASTVFSQDDLKIISKNLLELLKNSKGLILLMISLQYQKKLLKFIYQLLSIYMRDL